MIRCDYVPVIAAEDLPKYNHWTVKYKSKSKMGVLNHQVMFLCNYVPIIIIVSLIVVQKRENFTLSLQHEIQVKDRYWYLHSSFHAKM